jgi:hypothetical protein
MSTAWAACDASCLNDVLDRYLTQLVLHDPDPLPVADGIVAVENAEDMILGQGSWQTIAEVPAGQRFVDAMNGQSVFMGATKDASGQVGSIFIRLAVNGDGKVTESELFTKGSYTGASDPATLLTPDILYDAVVPPARRSGRADLMRTVNLYMDGISKHDGSDVPVSERCDRYQAGKKFTNSPERPVERGGGSCQTSLNNLTGQVVVNRRFPVIDVEKGIVAVLFIIPHGERSPPNATNVAEIFKIVEGKIRSIEEFSFVGVFPPNSGFAD